MRIAVMGAGGVGGFFGAKLALAGNDVTFIARGAHLAALRNAGLAIESQASPMRVSPARATDDPASIAPVDVVLFCVKLWDVEAAAQAVRPLVARGGVAIPFQNGLASPEILTRVLGADHVLGGVAYIAATIRAPGVVLHTGTMAKLLVGAFAENAHARAVAFAEAARAAAIDIEVSADIRRALWEKFALLAAMSGCTCLARQSIGVVREDPELRATLEGAVREAWTLGRSRGVALGDNYVEATMAAMDGFPYEMKASMLHDLTAGRRLEAQWLSGAVADMSEADGLEAPISRTLYAAMKPYLDGK